MVDLMHFKMCLPAYDRFLLIGSSN